MGPPLKDESNILQKTNPGQGNKNIATNDNVTCGFRIMHGLFNVSANNKVDKELGTDQQKTPLI
jgi:hypothetical protein